MKSLAPRGIAAALFLLASSASLLSAQNGSISGRVTDAEHGTPISDVRVELRGGSTLRNVLSGTDGSFRFGGLSSGHYVVTFSRVGYARLTTDSVNVGQGDIELSVTLRAVAVELDPTVITAGRQEQKALEAPAAVEVVSQREIEENPTLTVAEQLKSVPGVDQATTGIVSSNSVTRGFNNVFSGAMLTLTDNRYAFVPSLRVNTTFLVPTTNEDISRIEVLLGPASALYGPNSANGVMHVITRSPFESEGTTLSLGAGARSSSVGLSEDLGDRTFSRLALRHAGTRGERFGYKVSGNFTRGEDYHFQDQAEPPDARNFDVERWAVEAQTDFRPSDESEVILGFGRTQAGHAIEMTGLGAAQVKDWRYDYFQGRVRWNRLFAQAFVNTSNAGNTFLLRTGQPITDESRMYVAQIQHGFDAGTRLSLTYGIDAQRTDPRTGGTINGRNEDIDRIDEIGGYLHSEIHLTPRLDLFAAARLDKHSELEDPVFSPRTAIVFRPAENHNFRLTYNRAFSTPTTNNLFLDIVAGRIPFGADTLFVRTIGVPKTGFTFSRQCTGGVGDLCARSLFSPDPTAYLPADATLLWQAATNIVFQQSGGAVDIRAVPAPNAAQVGTVLRVLNPTTGAFSDVAPTDVRDIAPLKPTIEQVFETGYRGLVGERVLLSANVYYQQKKNFTGPLIVETPNVFLESSTLSQYLAAVFVTQGMNQQAAQAQADQLAAQMSGIPLATVTPSQALSAGPDLVLTYRNFGDLDLWGADAAFQALLTDRFTLSGSYSWASDDFFPRSEVGGVSDVALNAPASKGSLGIRYRDDRFSIGGRGRYVKGFPMNSGVYVGDVDGYSLLDLSLSYTLPFAQGLMLTLDVTNALNDKHQEFVGAPFIGRMIFLQSQFNFGTLHR
jgi:iron complex outermembrane receptor protein